jgi:hypothetical protein
MIRRDFLKATGATVAGFFLFGAQPIEAVNRPITYSISQGAFIEFGDGRRPLLFAGIHTAMVSK